MKVSFLVLAILLAACSTKVPADAMKEDLQAGPVQPTAGEEASNAAAAKGEESSGRTCGGRTACGGRFEVNIS